MGLRDARFDGLRDWVKAVANRDQAGPARDRITRSQSSRTLDSSQAWHHTAVAFTPPCYKCTAAAGAANAKSRILPPAVTSTAPSLWPPRSGPSHRLPAHPHAAHPYPSAAPPLCCTPATAPPPPPRLRRPPGRNTRTCQGAGRGSGATGTPWREREVGIRVERVTRE